MKNYTYIKNRKIKIAVVGCGRVSTKHFEAIKKYQDDFELIAFCDHKKNLIEKLQFKYKIKGYDNLKNMLLNENLDAVAVCTPSGLHAEHVILCAKHKVNVITEKPMATVWEDAIKMVKECDKENVRLLVVKQNRRNSTLKLLKRATTENRFGKIYMVHSNVFWNRSQEYYDQDEWRGTWKYDGGALMNQASHYVDLLDWLIGPVEKVQLMKSTTRKIEVEDTCVLNIKWRNGALGSMSVTMLTYPKNFEGSITILGEKGTVKIGGLAVNKILHWEFDSSKDYDKDVKKVNYETESVYGFGHKLYYKNVIDVLRGEVEPETDGIEGLKSLEILIAAYLSAREDKSISLPLGGNNGL